MLPFKDDEPTFPLLSVCRKKGKKENGVRNANLMQLGIKEKES